MHTEITNTIKQDVISRYLNTLLPCNKTDYLIVSKLTTLITLLAIRDSFLSSVTSIRSYFVAKAI